MRAGVFEELSALIYDGLAFAGVGEHGAAAGAPTPDAPSRRPAPRKRRADRPAARRVPPALLRPRGGARAGAAVPAAASRSSRSRRDDARARGIAPGDEVDVRSNGTSRRLRARFYRDARAGTVRAAEEHVAELAHDVEVKRA